MRSTPETKRQCLGNFCTIENPNCEQCGIDEAMDILEDFIRIRKLKQDINSIYQQGTSEHGD